MMSLQSSSQDSSLGTRKQGRKSDYLLRTPEPVRRNPDEDDPSDDFPKPRKYTTAASGKIVRMPYTGSI